MNLWALLWAIFIAEGATKASVPFGYLPLKARWRRKQVTFFGVLRAVIRELKTEWFRFYQAKRQKQIEQDKDFIWWLAWKGYNANPSEAANWEKNVRVIYQILMNTKL